MATKSSSPSPNTKTSTPVPAKQSRSRKAATTPNTDTGRAGSAGGILLEKPKDAKPNSKTIKPTQLQDTPTTSKPPPRRKPRKLNKDTPTTTTPAPNPPAKPDTDLEALKSRVHGLEAKVEQLYKSGSLERPGRSPRRRGKGRKGSTQGKDKEVQDGDGDGDGEEYIGRANDDEVEVEDIVNELEGARRDLAAFRSSEDDDNDVEEIPRNDGVRNENKNSTGKHVTLSGSYRIPLPSSISPADISHIQSGVTAAQNVARSILENRRSPNTNTPTSSGNGKQRPSPKSVSSSLEIEERGLEGGRKSWSEWIGGYSVAITRAVGKMEYEAGVESREGGDGRSGGRDKGEGSGGGKRPGVRTKGSGSGSGRI